MCTILPISPSRCTIPIPQLDGSPGMTPPRQSASATPKKRNFIPTLPLNGTVPRISADTLADLLQGEYDDEYDSLFIIDCRYDYEYKGGHIKGAFNLTNPSEMQQMFFDDASDVNDNIIIVFHCEFSHNRGPQMASMFREFDRKLNQKNYPNLFYPNVYVLDGGYRQFYHVKQELCDGGYVRMLDDNHRMNGDLIKATTQFRKNVEQIERENRKTLSSQPSRNNIIDSPKPFVLNQSPVVTKNFNFSTSPTQSKIENVYLRTSTSQQLGNHFAQSPNSFDLNRSPAVTKKFNFSGSPTQSREDVDRIESKYQKAPSSLPSRNLIDSPKPGLLDQSPLVTKKFSFTPSPSIAQENDAKIQSRSRKIPSGKISKKSMAQSSNPCESNISPAVTKKLNFSASPSLSEDEKLENDSKLAYSKQQQRKSIESPKLSKFDQSPVVTRKFNFSPSPNQDEIDEKIISRKRKIPSGRPSKNNIIQSPNSCESNISQAVQKKLIFSGSPAHSGENDERIENSYQNACFYQKSKNCMPHSPIACGSDQSYIVSKMFLST